MQDEKKKKISRFWKAIAWIIKRLSGIKKSLSDRKERNRKRKSLHELTYRIRNGERINPMCQYADCLIGLQKCVLLEKCLISELERCSK